MFYPSAYMGTLINDAQTLERPGKKWETEDYRFYEGSKCGSKYQDGCPTDGTMTKIALDWDCIPNVDVSWRGNSYNWVQACSNILE